MSSLRPFIAWVIGPWIAALFVWLGKRTGQAVDPELVTQTTNYVVDLLLLWGPLLLSTAGVSKQIINRWANPLNVSVNPDTVHPVEIPPEPSENPSRQTDFNI